MKTVRQSNLEILKALKIDPEKVGELIIHLTPTGYPTVTLISPRTDDLTPLAELLTSFKLIPFEEEEKKNG